MVDTTMVLLTAAATVRSTRNRHNRNVSQSIRTALRMVFALHRQTVETRPRGKWLFIAPDRHAPGMALLRVRGNEQPFPL